jgi:hypothetical protein
MWSMSVSEILDQIEALPADERFKLVEKLVERAEAESPGLFCPPISEAERLDLEKKLKQRPNLGAELAEKLNRMQAGHSVDFEDVKALHQQMAKLGL